MTMNGGPNESDTDRREFLKGVALVAGGLALSGGVERAFASTRSLRAPRQSAPPNWAGQIGLELWTVRDLIAKDYVGTLEKVAKIGYKEIEPAGGYANMAPKQFRALLDRLGLKMPSTHSGVSVGTDAEMEKQLAGFRVMGIEYTSLDEPRRAGRGGASGGGSRLAAGTAARRGVRAAPAASPAPNPAPSPAAERQAMQQFVRNMVQARAAEDVKHEAARYNRIGELARKFGIKLLIHNHTAEFLPCKDSPEVPYTILLNETDPELVVFQLDIGWAVVAGQNPVELFTKYPGRFVLWHVKDVAALKTLPALPDQGGRMAEARLVPVGNGEIDYGEIFKHADVAGMKHFVIEQDSAADWGDSIAAARVSYEHLRATLASRA
jgi:sugar phosphate isomerase/epimerase